MMDTAKEAKVLGKYLISKEVNNQTVALYEKAVVLRDFKRTTKDKKIEAFAVKFPFLLGFIDGGLALVFKSAVLRKKIFIMLAVLETIPEYSNKFLIEKTSFTILILNGIRGVYRGLVGVLLIKII